MRNSQSDTNEDEQPAGDQQTDDEAELPASDYYYDDSTGYEAYRGEDESDDQD